MVHNDFIWINIYCNNLFCFQENYKSNLNSKLKKFFSKAYHLL